MKEKMLQEDKAYQLICRASGFFAAAQIIVDSGNNNAELRAPVAHLIAHGCEILMKHILVIGGLDIKAVGKFFGHEIKLLWEAPDIAEFQEIVLEQAADSWRAAKASGKFDDDFNQDPKELLVQCLDELDRLHTNKSNYALRYTTDVYDTAPLPSFLLDTFRPVADRFRSRYLLSQRVQNNV
ncbi:MAG TPA: hypothetical protein VLA51_06150 [Paracoccaceae bacterium]|nr:hypothetical protein [Paracoccaceae bacterium]